MLALLTDIDECVDATTNNCDSNATCTNIPGGFNCTCNRNQGYIGNGTTCYGMYKTVRMHDMVILWCSGPPSPPAMLSTSPQSTAITLTWSQPPGDMVDSYQILYSFTIRGCGEVGGDNVSTSSREYTLTGLEENSDFTINITAMNGAGSSPPANTTARTLIDGRLYSLA